MTLRSYLWGIRVSATAALAAWILVILQVDPEKTGIVGQGLFYATTMLLLAGIFVLFFTWLRKNLGGNDHEAFVHIGISFRQGILMAMLTCLLLVLQQFRVLTWWDGALVIAGVFLIELYFLTRK